MENESPREKKRLWWIDHARGFIMIMLVVTMFIPKVVRESSNIARFFLEHPADKYTIQGMNFFDIGAPAFIFIMGLLMPLSFYKRKEKAGTGAATRHLLIRYGIILALGLLVILIDQGTFLKERDGQVVVVSGMAVVSWDVLPSLGLVGLVAIPFLWIAPKFRAIAASAMLVFYQIMLLFGGWREYAIASVHGGILGTVFGFGAIMIFATCFGEMFFVDENLDERKKYMIYGIAGAVAFVGGLLLGLIPEWYPNKLQVTLTYIMISMGTIILISYVFILIGKKYDGPIFGLDSYGKSPFFVYVVAIVSEFLISDIIDVDITWLIGLPMIIGITALVCVLDWKGKILKI